MKRLLLIVALLAGIAAAQTTTSITGTIKDLTGAVVTSGKVTFTLTPSRDTTISGLARFSPQTVTCLINGSGAIVALDGVSVCTVTMNTALQPPGSYYVVGIWPANVKTSTFTFYAVSASYDWSTVVPTPTTSPAQNFVDIFSNQTIGGSKVWSGTHTFNGSVSFPGGILGTLGPVTLSALNSSTQFADTFSGVDASCKIASAIGALPTNGGTVNALNLTDIGGTGTCTIDPGTKSVTILLGPYTYNVSQIILRTNTHLIGSGDGTGLGGTSKLPTLIQATGNNSTPPLVLATAAEGQEHVVLQNFRLVATAGNTSQNGISINATGLNGGLWYAHFEDIEVANFKGIGFDLEAPVGGGINQFSTFVRIRVFRVSGGSYGLQIKGWNNSLKFENCQFDGSPQVSGGDGTTTNINIDDFTGGIFPPYNIKFDLLTSQWSPLAMKIDAGEAVSIDQGHFEGDYNAITVGPGDSFGPVGVTIHDSWFGNGTGINSSNGSIINNTAATANAAVQIIDSHVEATPDTFMKGNKASIVSFGNTVGPEGSYVYLPPQTGAPSGFGAGSSGTAVTTTTKGGGTGPTTPQTIVQYQQVTINGTTYWVPLVQ